MSSGLARDLRSEAEPGHKHTLGALRALMGGMGTWGLLWQFLGVCYVAVLRREAEGMGVVMRQFRSGCEDTGVVLSQFLGREAEEILVVMLQF